MGFPGLYRLRIPVVDADERIAAFTAERYVSQGVLWNDAKNPAAPSEPFDFDVVLAQGVADLPCGQAEQAAGLGLDPAGALHGPQQALTRGGEFRLVGAAVADAHTQQLADRGVGQGVRGSDRRGWLA